MREGQDRLSKTGNPVEQERFDQEFLEGARRHAQKSAKQHFDQQMKQVKLNDPYTINQLEFTFNMNWVELESILKEKFNFRVEGANYIFTGIKEK